MANVLHSSLTTTDLHEPKGVAAATSGQVYIANGAGSGVWTVPTAPTFMQKHIAGLTYQNAAGDPTNDITILAGSARDTTNTEDMILSSSITKRLDATWVVGDNQGGLDTGAIANTSYHIWLIKRPDTGVVDVLFSTSATAPTMPTNYTKKRRIGSFVRGSSVIQVINVHELSGGGIEVKLNLVELSGTSCSATGTAYTLTNVPSGLAFEAYFNAYTGTSPVNNCRLLCWSQFQTGLNLGVSTAPTGVSVADGAVANTYVGQMWRIRTNGAAQVIIATSTGSTVTCTAHAWVDERRD